MSKEVPILLPQGHSSPRKRTRGKDSLTWTRDVDLRQRLAVSSMDTTLSALTPFSSPAEWTTYCEYGTAKTGIINTKPVLLVVNLYC